MRAWSPQPPSLSKLWVLCGNAASVYAGAFRGHCMSSPACSPLPGAPWPLSDVNAIGGILLFLIHGVICVNSFKFSFLCLR